MIEKNTADSPGRRPFPPVFAGILWLTLFTVWTAATWFLEGRIETLLRPDAVPDRMIYVVVANFVMGVGGSAMLVRMAGQRDNDWLSPAGAQRLGLSLLAGLLLGLAVYFLQSPASTNPLVLLNGYAQVMTVTVAEIAVCWWALAAVVKRILSNHPHWLQKLVVVVIGAGSFGIYHFGHSPPFDTWSMVGLLTVVGLFTGLFFVVAKELWGTLILHNFAGTLGVTNALAQSGRLDSYSQPRLPVLITGAVAVLVLWASRRWISGPEREQVEHT